MKKHINIYEIYVIEIKVGPGEEECDAVLNVEYYISEYFVNDTFDSCKEVKLPSLGIPVSGINIQHYFPGLLIHVAYLLFRRP